MSFELIFPLIILVLGVTDDLRSKKIHNRLIILLFLFGLLVVCVFQINWNMEKLRAQDSSFIPAVFSQILLEGFLPALGRFVLAFSLTLPLFVLNIIGGGDLKLYLVLSLVVSSPRELFFSLAFSFLWAGLLGFIKSILDHKFRVLCINIWQIIQFKKPSSDTLNVFPFSVSLLMGWLSAVFYF